MATYSNWREDLIEVIDTPTTEKKAEKKVKEAKVNNKVVINPTFKEAVAEMGGQILEVAEVDNKTNTEEDPQIKSKEKRQGMIKRQVLLKKLQAVRAGGGADITAGYEPEGDQLNELKKSTLGSYVKKASKDLANRSFDHGESEKRMYEPDKEDEKETKKQATRQKGIDRAADKLAKEEVEEVDESRLVKKLTRPIRRAKKVAGRIAQWHDDDPGRAHTMGSLGNPHMRNDEKRAAERKAGKKKVAEGYAKPNKELPKGSKVHVKKGVKVQGKYVKEASAVLDANTKIQKKEQRKKDEKEYAKLMAIYNHQKDLKKRGLSNSYEPEGEVIDEGIMKMVKKVIRSKKPAKKATMDATTDKLHDWRQKNSDEQKEREKYVSPFRPIVKEADDKAYKYVVSQLKKKYGDGVLTKGDKMPQPSAAQKKKNDEIRAKRAKEDGRDATEKASDGRYSDRYSNRGSD